MTHFKLFLCVWCKERIEVHVSKYVCTIVPHHLSRRLSIFHWIAFVLLLKINWIYINGSISRLYFLPLIYISGSQNVVWVPKILSCFPQISYFCNTKITVFSLLFTFKISGKLPMKYFLCDTTNYSNEETNDNLDEVYF